jgi:hypothetical protein
VGFGLAIPTISQPWYTGPGAVKFGDASFAVSMLVTALFYTPLRRLEIYWRAIEELLLASGRMKLVQAVFKLTKADLSHSLTRLNGWTIGCVYVGLEAIRAS